MYLCTYWIQLARSVARALVAAANSPFYTHVVRHKNGGINFRPLNMTLVHTVLVGTSSRVKAILHALLAAGPPLIPPSFAMKARVSAMQA